MGPKNYRFIEDSEGNMVSVLLVEDDEDMRYLIKRTFRSNGLVNVIVEAGDGIEALDILQSEKIKKPYFILLDVFMPIMDGIEFLEKLRLDPNHKNDIVFVLTVSDNVDVKKTTRELGVANFFNKTILDTSVEKFFEEIQDFYSVSIL